MILFFFKQKTAYEMRISDWSSDVALPSYSFWYNAGAIGSVVLQKRHEPLSLHSEILTSPICMMIEDDEAGQPRIMPYSGRSPLRRMRSSIWFRARTPKAGHASLTRPSSRKAIRSETRRVREEC